MYSRIFQLGIHYCRHEFSQYNYGAICWDGAVVYVHMLCVLRLVLFASRQ